MSTLVLLRHGQSTTNAAGEFTGWTDVPLTEAGDREAHHAGQLLRQAAVFPDAIHTSVLRRSIHTAQIVADELDLPWLPVHRSWRLNERHYGALTGRNKAEVRAEAGDARYRQWRRSFDTSPPPVPAEDANAIYSDPRYARLPAGTIPDTESLADVLARLLPYWVDVLAVEARDGRTPLVVAHGNSLRALVMHLDRLSPTTSPSSISPPASHCATNSTPRCDLGIRAGATWTRMRPAPRRRRWQPKDGKSRESGTNVEIPDNGRLSGGAGGAGRPAVLGR